MLKINKCSKGNWSFNEGKFAKCIIPKAKWWSASIWLTLEKTFARLSLSKKKINETKLKNAIKYRIFFLLNPLKKNEIDIIMG